MVEILIILVLLLPISWLFQIIRRIRDRLFWRKHTKKTSSALETIAVNTNPSLAETNEFPITNDDVLDITGAYQRKWLLTQNEKKAYMELKHLCDQYGYFLCSKVRLLDLVEPRKGQPKYKTYFWKIQAKHVDFVICNARLVAKIIIELDDNSHDLKERIARDDFVNSVLQSVGYKVIHTREISSAIKAKIVAFMNEAV